jgi:putative NADPH-quinone reductase
VDSEIGAQAEVSLVALTPDDVFVELYVEGQSRWRDHRSESARPSAPHASRSHLLRRNAGRGPPDSIREAQHVINWADHLVIFCPLWLSSMPAILKAFLERTFRPGFAAPKLNAGKPWQKSLSGKTARIVGAMGLHGALRDSLC